MIDIKKFRNDLVTTREVPQERTTEIPIEHARTERNFDRVRALYGPFALSVMASNYIIDSHEIFADFARAAGVFIVGSFLVGCFKLLENRRYRERVREVAEIQISAIGNNKPPIYDPKYTLENL
ncbi:MAG: hypothetical protein KJ718_04180 [Nanoarchaeota archaeon]|nr:hypothetical protein [Nanoarchaeota archaeon]MBU1051726.1 hypothetical protein [Nanoarchaeota archaeon]MBU1988976.1 hypothetical protein [Nanoarchaeota archaeon]